MAARAKGKPRQEAKPRAAGKYSASMKAAPSDASAPRKSPSKKASANKAATKPKTKSKPTHSKPIAKTADTAKQLLLDQNEALRAELEQANARIQQLEELNRNVLNRIDWVIDFLQGVLEARR